VSRLAAIFGCAGPRLLGEEAAFFREVRPWGFILFRRNIESPDQLRALTAALRETAGDGWTPVLVDQEGGRVQRLGPPHWPRYPPARAYSRLPAPERREMVRLGARLIAHDLRAVGIDVDCAPVLDTPEAGSHDIIGDRAFADTLDEVAALGRAFAEGLMAGAVLPVIKHLPGHGRARADSHEALPVVEAVHAALAARDFGPFRANADLPLAMTAHVVFAALDPTAPATTSKTVIGQVIRGEIGFDGLLITDDLSMKALSGDFASRATGALAAGCDVVLHCNGAMDEMRAVAVGARPLAGDAARRAQAALAWRAESPEPVDVEAARARFAGAFEGRWAA